MSRLIESLNEQQALNKCADGYEVYWTENNTYLTASHLREIADELDRRNKRWHEQVMQDVGQPMPKIKPLSWVAGNPQINEWIAETPLGKFRVIKRSHDACAVVYMAPFRSMVSPDLVDVEETKKACEQEYERRVRECLL